MCTTKIIAMKGLVLSADFAQAEIISAVVSAAKASRKSVMKYSTQILPRRAPLVGNSFLF